MLLQTNTPQQIGYPVPVRRNRCFNLALLFRVSILLICLFVFVGECFTIFSWTHCSTTPSICQMVMMIPSSMSFLVHFLKKALINRKAALAVEELGLSMWGSVGLRNLQFYKETGCSRGSRPPLTNQINQSINYFAAKTRLI